MVMLFLLCFADFTYQPAAGVWLDYARSRPLSSARHLVVEHSGPRGDYSGGGSQKVLDNSGRVLYELTTARGAWFVTNGVAGNEDTFLYQKHESSTTPAGQPLHLWHPQYGDREVKVMGKILAQDRKGLHVQVSNQGTRISVISQSDTLEDGNYKACYHLEVLDLKGTIAELFTSPEVPYSFYADARIEAPSCKVIDEAVYFHNLLERQVQMFDLRTFGADPQVVEIETAFDNRGFSISAGYMEYLTFWDGSNAMALEGINDAEPLFVLAEADKERPGYKDLAEFLQAFPAKAVYRENDFLYAKHKDRFFAYDLTHNILSVYSTSTWPSESSTYGGEWTAVTKDRDVVVNASSYSVTAKTPPLGNFKTSRPVLLVQVDANAFRKTIL